MVSNKAVVLLVACFAAAVMVNAQTRGCSLTIQFNNSQRSVEARDTSRQINRVLAEQVFLVPVNQVTLVGGLDQGGFFRSRATLTYYAVGPTTNGKDVCDNCEENVSSRWLGLRNSVLASEINSATGTWWPGSSVNVDSASCQVS